MKLLHGDQTSNIQDRIPRFYHSTTGDSGVKHAFDALLSSHVFCKFSKFKRRLPSVGLEPASLASKGQELTTRPLGMLLFKAFMLFL